MPILEKHLILEVFDISGNALTNSGISAILKALIVCHSRSYYILQYIYIISILLPLTKYLLQPNKVLREFYTEANLLSDKVATLFSQLVTQKPTLTTLSIAKNKVCS